MEKYAKIINEETKECQVGFGNNVKLYQSMDMTVKEVEKAYNGNWYLTGFAPVAPEKSYTDKRVAEYPQLSEQLDMIYWDKVNNTNLWQAKITEIKTKYPKA